MNTSQLYAAASLVSAIVDFILLAGVSWHFRRTIHRSWALRAVYPATLALFALLALAYWQVLQDASSPVTLRRLTAAISTHVLFAVVTLATLNSAKFEAQAEKTAAVTQKVAESEERRLAVEKRWIAEREAYLVVIGHELATPINLITGYLEMLSKILPTVIEDDEQQQQLQSFAEGAISGAARLRVMLRMFNATTDRPKIVPLNLCDVVYQAINHPDLYTATRRRPEDVPITVDCSSFVVHGDEMMLETAVFELVRNGLKVTRQGYIQIEVLQAGDVAVIAVEDNGRGVPSVDIPRIWEAGFQSSGRYSVRPDEGAGYGLSVVLHVAKAHGGDAALEWTEPGEGSRFAIYLPLG